ncbi:MAG: bifunctional DNA-formamidopyrimidine glycosylase/DNA-(apurinic or apyrimidinic site) lyase [Proteobacteria bacterium]|nr:bifunctional DNA-formamidopyrimidine glycosylase/DNA-(apurinic or apyrimidinic site) lyase [Pseudomonadota bacterium]
MPELPEVETVVRGLERAISGKTISEVRLNRADLRTPLPKNLAELLEGRKITGLSRRAKYILIHLDSGQVWIIHLGMSGQILVHQKSPNSERKHDHVVTTFGDRSVMIFNDARRFGLMDITSEKSMAEHALFAHLGPEPLEKSFTGAALKAALTNKKAPIKTAIMDQRVVVGVGNIYASESLYRSHIHPKTLAGKLTPAQCELLVKNIKAVLKSAIQSGGSTLRDFVRSSGDAGYFQHEFQVYERENEPCLTCKTAIERIVQQGRSTYFCPRCQKR